jgi:hypothetical protein
MLAPGGAASFRVSLRLSLRLPPRRAKGVQPFPPTCLATCPRGARMSSFAISPLAKTARPIGCFAFADRKPA